MNDLSLEFTDKLRERDIKVYQAEHIEGYGAYNNPVSQKEILKALGMAVEKQKSLEIMKSEALSISIDEATDC